MALGVTGDVSFAVVPLCPDVCHLMLTYF
jgi:hypothetical protein